MPACRNEEDRGNTSVLSGIMSAGPFEPWNVPFVEDAAQYSVDSVVDYLEPQIAGYARSIHTCGWSRHFWDTQLCWKFIHFLPCPEPLNTDDYPLNPKATRVFRKLKSW